MKSLTNRQREVLDFISKYLEDNSFPPTVREIGENFNISLRAVQDHLSALQKKGYISQRYKCSRSMKVLKNEKKAESYEASIQIPVIGTLEQGRPILSEENYAGYITVAEPFINKDLLYYALRISDSSMSGAGIYEGDIAIIQSCDKAMEGQIVVVMTGNTILLRKYSTESNRICLSAENDDVQPVYCQDVRVVGTLSCIIRSYR
ncbi:MAG: transcriptional repressor LexA [Treponema sp.]|nr:transcriptional repressor LexA [Treponema sp.]